VNEKDERRPARNAAATINSPGADDISDPGRIPHGAVRIPVLIVEFPLEGTPRALNSRDLSDDDVRRLTDWISNRATFPGLTTWATRLLAVRGEWTA
jgi:hypothetical protein